MNKFRSKINKLFSNRKHFPNSTTLNRRVFELFRYLKNGGCGSKYSKTEFSLRKKAIEIPQMSLVCKKNAKTSLIIIKPAELSILLGKGKAFYKQ